MGHALNEIKRLLVREGILIDLRPLADHAPVAVISSRETHQAGHITQLPEDLADDEAANAAIAEATHRNWFTQVRQEFFPFFYYWDSPQEMQEYIEEEWADYITIPQDVWRDVRAIWAVSVADAYLRIQLKMLITRLKVVKDE